jgi:hypothetical protein
LGESDDRDCVWEQILVALQAAEKTSPPPKSGNSKKLGEQAGVCARIAPNLDIPEGTIHHLGRGLYGTGHCTGKPMHIRQFNLRSENVMADLCLGAAIVGIDTLIAVGLFIVFI